MIWSFSDSRTFKICQRKWYFKRQVANGNAKKDPLRREAYLLSKLQSIDAWRGLLVDKVISEQIIPNVRKVGSLDKSVILSNTRQLFEKQLEFARQHRLREPGMAVTKAGESFSAFFNIEYGIEVSNEKIAQAWHDVETALQNLLEMKELIKELRESNYLVAQRPLSFPYQGVTVRATPDLIGFFAKEPPLIVDWKVHSFGTSDYRLQLACYAIALKRCQPHKDFPGSLTKFREQDIRLLEVQLLTNEVRRYTLSAWDVDEVESVIAESAQSMELALGNRENGMFKPFEFSATSFPEACQRCAFRSLCWEVHHDTP